MSMVAVLSVSRCAWRTILRRRSSEKSILSQEMMRLEAGLWTRSDTASISHRHGCLADVTLREYGNHLLHRRGELLVHYGSSACCLDIRRYRQAAERRLRPIHDLIFFHDPLKKSE